MFIPTPKDTQLRLFGNIHTSLSSRKRSILDKPEAWHNVFFREVIQRIDESPFAVFYSKDMGRSNISIRVVLGMIILKEGQGWSDAQLFEQCRFNIQTMLALGLAHFDDDVPVEASYYNFKRQIVVYEQKHGISLIGQAFKQVTTAQISRYGVLGTKIRLDSKLIQSNIARSSRLGVILKVLEQYLKHQDLQMYTDYIGEEELAFLQHLGVHKSGPLIYELNSTEKKELLQRLGLLIGQLLQHPKASKRSKKYKQLRRIFEEQYEVIKAKNEDNSGGSPIEIQLKENKHIKANSLQSPHDDKATFRKKGKGANVQKIRGFHANITEVCDEDLNMILDVQLAGADVSESKFLQPSIEGSEEVLQKADQVSQQAQAESIANRTTKTEEEKRTVKEVITDGGYDDIDNRQAMSKEGQPTWKLSKMKGKKRVYRMEKDSVGKLRVWDVESGEECAVSYSEKASRYVIKSAGRGPRYMTLEEIDRYILALKYDVALDTHTLGLRANMESTIHQVFHRLKKRNKMVYRGYEACHNYVWSRAFWVNFTRICKKTQEKTLILSQLALRALIERVVINMMTICLIYKMPTLVSRREF